MFINENSETKIIPLAGGKGGVGKTVLCANLGLALAETGKRTILIDLDLGGANLHSWLALKNTNTSIGHLLSHGMGGQNPLPDLLLPTPYPNLAFIPGDVFVFGSSQITAAKKKKIIDGILSLDADYILIDLGAGSSFSVIDFFLTSNAGLIVSTPQTTSILNAYSFLKNMAYRFLRRIFEKNKEVSHYLGAVLREKTPSSAKTMSEILAKMASFDSQAAEKAAHCLSVLRPHLIINMANHPGELSIAEGLKELCLKNLALSLECLGFIFHDKSFAVSLADRVPYFHHYRNSVPSLEIERIAQKLIQSAHFPEMPLALDYYEDSYALTQIEAENDYSELTPPETAEQREGELKQLVDLVAIQQKKIRDLEDTVGRLTLEGRRSPSEAFS